jgi:hypothetical protein
MSTNFEDMLWADGQGNMGGLKTIGYYALAADIDEWPAIAAVPTSAAEEVTLVGNFRMKEGKSWKKLYNTMETGKIDDQNQGERDCQSFNSIAEIFYPGTKAEVLGFMKLSNNSNMVFILDELSGGNRRVLGTQGLPAKVKPSSTTGVAAADRKGMTLEIQCYGDSPAPLYEGVIELESDVIS